MAKTTNPAAGPDSLYSRQDGRIVISPNGRRYLKDKVTNLDDDTYALTEGIRGIDAGAGMGRLSRFSGSFRDLLVSEFADDGARATDFLERVLTQYGDDSVQQLVGQHLIVENASNLLTKKVEWGRLAAYLEQSTRYISFDKKAETGKFRYYTPPELSPADKDRYEKDMDEIFTTYAWLVNDMIDYVRRTATVPESERDGAFNNATRAKACDAARAVLPVALTSTVGIFASGQALENMIMRLLADETAEARLRGEKILKECRLTLSEFLQRADKPERGGANIAYMSEKRQALDDLADELLGADHRQPPAGLVADNAKLIDYFPKDEFDLVADLLFEVSQMSLEEIGSKVGQMDDASKKRVFATYFGRRLNRRQKPGRALERAHYSWEITCDYGIFRDLQRHRMVDAFEWQQLTPAYGYDIPELIQEAGKEHVVALEKCFQIAADLYEYIRQRYSPTLAQYTVLLGHKMRWRMTYNARQAFHLHELRTSPAGHINYRRLVQAMHQKLLAIHPNLIGGITFVNKDETPELNRLAAERYANYKARQIDARQMDD